MDHCTSHIRLKQEDMISWDTFNNIIHNQRAYEAYDYLAGKSALYQTE